MIDQVLKQRADRAVRRRPRGLRRRFLPLVLVIVAGLHAGCHGRLRHCCECDTRSKCVRLPGPDYYGHYPTCWQPWPPGWGCHPTEIGPYVPEQVLPADIEQVPVQVPVQAPAEVSALMQSGEPAVDPHAAAIIPAARILDDDRNSGLLLSR
jgi:hypothetical protein